MFTRTQVTTPQQGQLQDHEQHLGELDKNTKEALDRAEAAGRPGRGKVPLFRGAERRLDEVPGRRFTGLRPEAKSRLMEFVPGKLKTDSKNVYAGDPQGYTDATRLSGQVNRRLGEEQAEAVRRYHE